MKTSDSQEPWVRIPSSPPNQVKIQYLNCQLILKTAEGDYKYETATSGRIDGTSTAISASTTTKQFTFTNALAKKITKESHYIFLREQKMLILLQV